MKVFYFHTYKRKRLLETNIEELNISVRTYNLLKKLKIKSLGELLESSNEIRVFIQNDSLIEKDMDSIFRNFQLVEGA